MKKIISILFFITLCYAEDYQVGVAVKECDGVVYYEPSQGAILDGLRYFNIFRYQTDCVNAKNTYGKADGTFAFTHPIVALNDNNHPLTCGACWFNLKDEVEEGEADFVSISKLAPLLDGLESLGTETNQKLNQIDSKMKSINDRQSKLDTDLSNSDFNSTINGLLDGESTNNELNELGNQIVDGFAENTDSISNMLDFESSCVAPAPVILSMMGHTFTIFSVDVIAPFVETIRNIFIFFAYVSGLFLVFRNV